MESQEELSQRLKDSSAPEWAKDARNCRGMMQWDSTQYICVTQVNGCLVEGILDTGAAATIMDMGMAMDLGLKVVR